MSREWACADSGIFHISSFIYSLIKKPKNEEFVEERSRGSKIDVREKGKKEGSKAEKESRQTYPALH
jgi:hypothetical protein